MTSSIHLIALKRIEGLIQKQVYRVDRPATDPPDEILARIDAWEAGIPAEAASPTSWNIPCVSRDYFIMRGLEARLYLLRPFTASPSADRRNIALLAKFSAEACETHKRLHQSPTWWISLEALRTTFLDGLTLLHAARLDPTALPASVLQRAIRANSNTLFTYIQHFPAAQSFHDAFEDLASRVLDFIATPPSETPNGGSALPLPLPMSNPHEFPWASLLTEMPSVMNVDFQDDYTTLLESLGIPIDNLVPQAFSDDAGGAGGNLSPSVGDQPFQFANLF